MAAQIWSHNAVPAAAVEASKCRVMFGKRQYLHPLLRVGLLLQGVGCCAVTNLLACTSVDTVLALQEALASTAVHKTTAAVALAGQLTCL
jgi:hypothetical protein